MYDSFLDPATGLLPADRVVAVIGNLGRPGLKFEQFSVLIQKIGFSLSDEQLKAIFLAVDLDQSFVMDASEAILGIGLLVSDYIPKLCLEEASLSTVQIVRYVLRVCMLAFFIFSFILIAFNCFISYSSLGSSDSTVASVTQTVLLGVASTGLNEESLNFFDENQISALVLGNIEKIMGFVRQAKNKLD